MDVPRNDWQLSCSTIKERGSQLLQSGQYADCTFIVGGEPNKVAFQGHKLILTMASPVFEAMFYGGIPERNAEISILDVQPDAFKALLEYIYTDKINLPTFDKACELCYAAKKYMLPHLVNACTKYLWSDLVPKNACRAYEFAKLFDETELMEKSLQILRDYTKEVIQDASFLDVEIDTITTIYSLDKMAINNELELFHAIQRYAEALEKKTDEQSPPPEPLPASELTPPKPPPESPTPSTSKVDVNSKDNPESVVKPEEPSEQPVSTGDETTTKKHTNDKEVIMNKLRGVLQQIRFLCLTPQEFAEGPAKSSLFTESESFAILMNILSTNANLPMPEGFSTSRAIRTQTPVFTVDTPSPVEPTFVESPRYPKTYSTPSSRVVVDSLLSEFLGGRSSMVRMPDLNEVSHDEFHRVYCHRPLLHSTSCLNTSVLDCCLTFMVDKNICLLGIQVPTQVPEEVSSFPGPSYSELIYAHLLDADGSRLTYTHYTNRVPYRHLLDIMFNRPVYIQRNKVYKVGLVLNKVGWYQMGTCPRQVAAESVFFNFGIGNTNECVRDGLIRSIIFTY